ncbi:MAG: hypothetical protein EWM72_01150 [Nitrospira sp.]|nr:MAG: hypothetical protein EWM72_01150 [Nitrospira sp.]
MEVVSTHPRAIWEWDSFKEGALETKGLSAR